MCHYLISFDTLVVGDVVDVFLFGKKKDCEPEERRLRQRKNWGEKYSKYIYKYTCMSVCM